MNGGLTYKDLDLMKKKSKALDDALEYLRGLQLCEHCIRVTEILEAAKK
jgi:hypothetical protein